jgi:crotonobetainyl-CoA:carnitine CoA-transferase CaiB-like acyl-CoA transferase
MQSSHTGATNPLDNKPRMDTNGHEEDIHSRLGYCFCMSQQSGFGPLQGVKVLELGHVMAGPVCGMMLADMGAEVIKLEKIACGDDSSRMVPPRIKDESAAFLILNRNKRGIAVDLKFTQGIEIVKRLIGRTDILIENFRLGTMERLGLGYEELRNDEIADMERDGVVLQGDW